MELDELKSVWKKAHDQDKAGYWVSEDDLKAMIHKDSRATISDVARQVKRKIRMSGIVGGGAFLLGLFVLLRGTHEPDFFLWLDGWQYGVMMLLMSSTILLIHFHSRFRLKQIKAVEQSSDTLKHAVLRTHELFQKVIKTGIWSDTIVTPTVLLFVTGVSLYEEKPFALDHRILILLAIGAAGAFFFHYLGRYMLNRKFGHFFKLLEQRKQELEDLEEK